MPAVNEDGAKKFLASISEKDSVAVIHHDDLDGYASGMLFYDYCLKKTKKVDHIHFTYGSSQELVLKKVKKHDKVIITDLGPGAIPEILEGLAGRDVLYVDHHQKDSEIPSSITEYRTLDQGYIPCARTAYELCGGKYWLGVAGTLSDMGHRYKENEAFLASFLKTNNISRTKFLETVVFIINKFLLYFFAKKQKAFLMLKKIKDYKDVRVFKKYARPVEREIQDNLKRYKKEHIKLGIVNYFEMDPKYPIKSTVTTQLGIQHSEDVIVIAVKNEKKGVVKLSGRTNNPKGNVITALRTGIEGLENANAGGHIPAAGGQIQLKDLETFKENLKRYML